MEKQRQGLIFAHIKDDVLFSSLFPTIKLSHPEAERKFQKSFLRFSLFCIYTG
ncbi:hypothetical protein BACCOPRO_03660 [Phocaeicola coprophilus DSM 18228 = JCM 13818]|uniref:Uncharacterized protein n=1 Tax=Phocaeicola coprophilus DSM 18228 = JCM 13818 TaxID=547042 RepID=S0FDD4_9BACT|nr:hypothetical protein BACCOPRO_03660 [Phocaeicola coprophilus DSM 18228 = JCM 13818]